MKIEKQKIVLQAIKSGRYRCVSDEVYSLRYGRWNKLLGGLVDGGYRQVVVSNHRNDDGRASTDVYLHILIYMIHTGKTFGEGKKIVHLDGDVTNNEISNLSCVPSGEKIERDEVVKRPIREKEIAAIRELHAKGLSQSAIARELKLNRLSVRYTIKKIESGEPLKHEAPRVKSYLL
jgi:hypothetical protein